MRRIVLERRLTYGSEWEKVAVLPENAAPATIVSEDHHLREVYQYGFVGGRPGLWVTRFSVDPRGKSATAEKVNFITDLSGEPHEFVIYKTPTQTRVRLRVEEEVHDGS